MLVKMTQTETESSINSIIAHTIHSVGLASMISTMTKMVVEMLTEMQMMMEMAY